MTQPAKTTEDGNPITARCRSCGCIHNVLGMNKDGTLMLEPIMTVEGETPNRRSNIIKP